eukprot:15175013-Alexandrium_andersonii.AAC.1
MQRVAKAIRMVCLVQPVRSIPDHTGPFLSTSADLAPALLACFKSAESGPRFRMPGIEPRVEP